MRAYLLYEMLYFHVVGKRPLQFGMAALAAWYGDAGPVWIKEYRVETDHDYSVKTSVSDADDPWGGTSRQVGVARVSGVPGDFSVEFETSEPSPRFYSVWRVDREGIANLSEILMSTGPYGGGRA